MAARKKKVARKPATKKTSARKKTTRKSAPVRKTTKKVTKKTTKKKVVRRPVSEDVGLVRLNKYLADHGVDSRRKCDELIRDGHGVAAFDLDGDYINLNDVASLEAAQDLAIRRRLDGAEST